MSQGVRRDITRPARRPAPSGRRRGRTGAVAVLAETVAFAVLLGSEGSPAWMVVRLAVALAVGALALVVELHPRPVLRAVTTLGLALAGLATGIGIGVMHAVKGDPTVAAGAAIVVLGAAVVLLGLAVHRLWSVTPGWWRLLAVPVAFVAFEFVLFPVTVAVYATNVPATHLDARTPAEYGLAYEDVRLPAADGVRLSAWYIPSRNGAAVVALHGAGSTRTGVLAQAAVLARHGYGVLLLDARGHGRSAGTAMDNGWWGDSDVDGAVAWMQRRSDVQDGRVGLLGLSMGGEEAIGAAADNPAVRAVVAEGALWRGSMDTAWLPHTLTGIIERAMLGVQTAVSAALTSAPPPPSLQSALRRTAPRLVLLIAGRPELRGDRYLYEHSSGNVRLWTLPDTPHTAGLARHPSAWERQVTTFLDRALLTG